MANFDDLHTGSTGGIDITFGNEKISTEQTEAIRQQQLEIEELLPSVKQLLNVIDEEIAAVADIRAYMQSLPDSPSREEIEAEYRGRELFIGMAERLKTSIANKLADSGVMEV